MVRRSLRTVMMAGAHCVRSAGVPGVASVFASVFATALLAPRTAEAQRTPPPDMPIITSTQPGYLGLLLQFSEPEMGQDSTHYPVVLSVEGDSPAARAGFLAGDTVLSYNKIDARAEPTALMKFLTPNRKINFRYRRNGLRSVDVVVARRRDAVIAEARMFSVQVNPRGGARVRMAERENEGVRVGLHMMPGPAAIVAPLTVRMDVPVMGATITRMNAGLANAMRVENAGMLVIDVVPETPAAAAGMREGDVVLSVDGTAVDAAPVLLQAIQTKNARGERSVVLEIVRNKKKEKVFLKW
jgi:C-terminal processing protease CtpA/Prc